jgi:putative tryptophan/tyrosine transport system substrate-binding protein
MKRREFVAALGSAAAWPVVARAEQPKRLPTIGFLGAGTASAGSQWAAAFVQRLRELNWVGDRTVAIEFRWADGHNEQLTEIADEFVRLKVDVIVTYANTVANAIKRTVTTIPIVFAAAGDPVGTGLVASLARPGGNVTGLSLQQPEIASKRLQILLDLLPNLHALAILANSGSPNAVLEMGEADAAARRLGLSVVRSEVQKTEDFAPTFDALKGRAEALYVCSDPLLTTNRVGINTLALGVRLPTMHGFREFVEAGGLISYGPNFPDLFRRAAEYVDKILRGAKPADLPVEQPTKFDLVINLTTAKALGLTVPESFLLRVNEVIE